MKKQLYLAAIVLFIMGTLKAQNYKEVIDNDGIVIEGVLIDSVFALTPDKKVTVAFHISSFATNVTLAPSTKYQLQVQPNKPFKIVIPPTAERFYMHVNLEKQNFSGMDNIYMLEKGDRITCRLSTDFFEFSGKGAAKLQCQSEIYRHRYKGTEERLLLANGLYKEYMAFKNRINDSLLRVRLETVKKFRPVMKKEVADILSANCYGLRYGMFYKSQSLYYNNYERIQAFLNSKEFLEPEYGRIQQFDPDVLLASPNYVDFIFYRVIMENVKFQDGKITKTSNNDIFQHIRDKYSGMIREKLIVLFFLHYKRSQGAVDYLDEALLIVQRTNYKKILTELKNALGTGVPFYPFELEDSNRNIVKLEDFKDNIVILDFWFTGCIPCRQFNKAMEPVIHAFLNNPLVKIVSIGVDKEREKWIKSISTEEYTSKEAINLYAGAGGMNGASGQALIKAYNITAYPTLFILKDGKIFSATPPRPMLDKNGMPTLSGGTKELIELINKALAENLQSIGLRTQPY